MDLIELLVKYGLKPIEVEDWEGYEEGTKPDYKLKTDRGEIYYSSGDRRACDKGLHVYSGLGSPEDYGYELLTDDLEALERLLSLLITAK